MTLEDQNEDLTKNFPDKRLRVRSTKRWKDEIRENTGILLLTLERIALGRKKNG